MPADRTRVIGIGVACQDYLLQVPSLRLVHRGCRLQGFKMQGGGPVATAMVAVARLGGEAELWTVLGEDHHGRLIEEELQRERVDLSHSLRLPGRPSAFNFVLVDGESGERVFLSPGSDWRLDGLDVERDWSRIDTADALLVSSSWVPVVLKALRRARDRGVPTCADIGHIAGNEALLELIDYLVVPAFAAEAYAGSSEAEALRALAAFGARMTVITRGSRGALYLAQGETAEMPAFEVSAIDTTGAGDVFHGAFAYGVGRGWAPRQLMLFSSAVAALKCTQLGGRTGIPGLSRTREFLEARCPGESLDWLTPER